MIIAPADLQPLTKTLEGYPDVTLTIKRATLSDEGRRYQMLFAGDDLVNMIDIALVETWLTLKSATITPTPKTNL
jgi:hypothetical protein